MYAVKAICKIGKHLVTDLFIRFCNLFHAERLSDGGDSFISEPTASCDDSSARHSSEMPEIMRKSRSENDLLKIKTTVKQVPDTVFSKKMLKKTPVIRETPESTDKSSLKDWKDIKFKMKKAKKSKLQPIISKKIYKKKPQIRERCGKNAANFERKKSREHSSNRRRQRSFELEKKYDQKQVDFVVSGEKGQQEILEPSAMKPKYQWKKRCDAERTET